MSRWYVRRARRLVGAALVAMVALSAGTGDRGVALALSPHDGVVPPHVSVEPAPPAGHGARYFPQTGHNMSGPFLAFYVTYGGLGAFGYPRTEVFSARGHAVQLTDRFMLELVGGAIRTGPLGRWLTAGRSDRAFAPVRACASAADLWVSRTGHCIRAGWFLTFWRDHAALLGAPIAENTVEENGDGRHRKYLLQWFENGRLEYHDENDTPAARRRFGTRYVMELGMLGKEYLERRGWHSTLNRGG